jgi:hypothetical protein
MGPSPQHTDTSSYYEPDLVTVQTTSEVIQGAVAAGQSQTQGSPQPGKTMFDFISPFDALASSSVAPPIRKPAPPLSNQQPSPEPFEDTWSSAVIDPKRKSVDNLLEQIGSPKAPIASSVHSIPGAFEQHTPDEEAAIAEPMQSKAASRPLPPKPMQAPSPPRASPPKVNPPVRREVQGSEPHMGPPVGPSLSHVVTSTTQREKESSPGPRGSWKGHDGGRNRGSGSKVKTQSGPM